MLGILVAIRNFTIALLLAWMGFSIAPDSDEDKKSSSALSNSQSISGFVIR